MLRCQPSLFLGSILLRSSFCLSLCRKPSLLSVTISCARFLASRVELHNTLTEFLRFGLQTNGISGAFVFTNSFKANGTIGTGLIPNISTEECALSRAQKTFQIFRSHLRSHLRAGISTNLNTIADITIMTALQTKIINTANNGPGSSPKPNHLLTFSATRAIGQ